MSLLLALAIALPLAFAIHGASAFRGWCRADPQFMINGQLAFVAVEAGVRDMRAARELSTGPISIVLTVPSGVPVLHLASDNGFGYGYDVSIEWSLEPPPTDQAIPVRVDVYVPMRDPTVPIRTSFTPAEPTDVTRIDGAADLHLTDGNGALSDRGMLAPGAAFGIANTWITIAT